MAVQIALRIEDELLAELDALIPLLNTPWRRMTRSDVLRAVVVMGLPALKAQGRAMANAMAPATPVRPTAPQEPAQQDEPATIAMTRDETENQCGVQMPIVPERSGPEVAVHDFGYPPKSHPLPRPAQAAPRIGERRSVAQRTSSPQLEDPTLPGHEPPPSSRPVAANAANVRSRLDRAIRSGALKLLALADEIGVSRSYVQNFKGGTSMSQEKLRALDAALRRHGV